MQTPIDPRCPEASAKRHRRLAIATVAAVVMIGAIVWFSGPGRIADVSRSIGWRGIGWLFVLYLGTQVTRAARLWVAMRQDTRPSFAKLLCISTIHQLLNHLLPARLGELGFPLLMRRFTAVPTASSVSLLVFVRLQEIFVLALVFALGALAVSAGSSGALKWLAVVIMVAVIALQLMLRPILRILAGAVAPGTDMNSRLAPSLLRVSRFLTHLEDELAIPLTIPRRVTFFGLTVLVWLSTFYFFHEVLWLAGTGLGFGETIVGSALANLTHILPVNALGSFGSLEAGWALGFSMLGLDPKAALATGLVMHVLVLAYLGLLTAPAWVWLTVVGEPAARPD